MAQRQGFKALWAKTNNRPASQAPNLPDSTLDEMVSSIVVEREQIGPTRYIADLGILFDRSIDAWRSTRRPISALASVAVGVAVVLVFTTSILRRPPGPKA